MTSLKINVNAWLLHFILIWSNMQNQGIVAKICPCSYSSLEQVWENKGVTPYLVAAWYDDGAQRTDESLQRIVIDLVLWFKEFKELWPCSAWFVYCPPPIISFYTLHLDTQRCSSWNYYLYQHLQCNIRFDPWLKSSPCIISQTISHPIRLQAWETMVRSLFGCRQDDGRSTDEMMSVNRLSKRGFIEDCPWTRYLGPRHVGSP